jgi:hypothetical protein
MFAGCLPDVCRMFAGAGSCLTVWSPNSDRMVTVSSPYTWLLLSCFSAIYYAGTRVAAPKTAHPLKLLTFQLSAGRVFCSAGALTREVYINGN